jgi:hypothetical protein
MPIAKDDGTQSASSAASRYDREIIDMLADERAQKAAVKAASASVLPRRPPAAELAAMVQRDLPNFNPEALISAGRVQEADPIIGPWRVPPYTTMKQKRIEVPKDTGQRAGVLGLLGSGQAKERPARGKREPAIPEIDYHAPSGGPARKMTTPGGAMVDLSIAEELAMKAGAITTVPEIEAGTTGSEALDAEILDQLSYDPRTGMGTRQYPEGSPGYAYEEPARVETEKQEAKEAARDARRTERREARAEERATGKGKKADRIDAQSYKDLSPDQKAAVDFNTLLFKATTADEKILGEDRASVPADVGTEYGESIGSVFGPQTGPPIFAPNTVNLLNSIGFKTEDLDMADFLKLKVGITQADLRGFNLETRSDEVSDTGTLSSESIRHNLQEDLVQAFQATREDQVSGEGLKNLQRDLLGQDQKIGFQQLTPDTNPAVIELQDRFQRGLTTLAQPKAAADKDMILAALKTEFTAPQWESFINFLDVSSREAMQYNRPLGSGPEYDRILDEEGNPPEYMLARDFRKHIGF